MKKILFVILFLSGICCTKALELNYSDWSEEYPKGVKDIFVESEDRYLWYKSKEENVEYLIKEKISEKLYDVNDFKIYESKESFIEPEKYSDRIINVSDKEVIYSSKDAKVLYLSTINNDIKISEIVIYDKNKKKINYSVLKDYSYLNDDVIDVYLPFKGEIYLYFDKNYDMNEINIYIYFNKDNDKVSNLKANILSSDNDIIYFTEFNFGICKNKSCIIDINTCDLKSNFNHIKKVYKYIDKLYKTYNIKKEYENGYYTNLDGYEKDEDSKKTFYRYITNKFIIVDIKDNIVTDEKYCQKSFCRIIYLDKEEEKKEENPKIAKVIKEEERIINNPQTYDPVYDYIILFIASSITLTYFIVEKSRMIKKSNNVESIQS